ncbi:thiamine pyrophosphate-binding protein [Actinoplanes xinjiangensis]|uniref:Thiamine pyrophosphate-dependent acetolactate synthase large subunit-like protein n=1 Tax=Actinoplanes xinjiangensis TaxID=512350 RepID=A0A316EG70_9ACTN|nr:thiamine pyrophosphate-binding protein [Actinoplanes xinjiangensis]PWK30514.1 thiamine pyrophosphate-dependent acetolactate synthase large subunit-like protein [Actinoplanes xinjiangensis]GIF44453.1 acetolactate synthase I/II/III large subunit [Actinoplanes xinjiangensis]
MSDRTVADVVGETLARLGADLVFGVVGSGHPHVTNALVANGARFVATRHEGGAATAADAYARVSGRPGVITVHQGGGLTNAMTGIAEAAKSRTPLIVLAVEPAAGRVDQGALAHAVGAVGDRVHGPASAVADTTRAWRTAVLQRRTVVLHLPMDVQAEAAEPDEVPPAPAMQPPRASDDAVTALAHLLKNAGRPVFIAGRGALCARAEVEALAAAAGALLATSAAAKGLFAGDDWNLDVSGGFATPPAAELIRDADVVVAWGASLDGWTTRHGALIGPDAAVVQVDLEPSAFGVHHRVDLGICGDARLTALAVAGALPDQRQAYRTDEVRAKLRDRGRWRDVGYTDTGDGSTIDPRTLAVTLDDLLPAERVIAVDAGDFMGYPSMFLSVPDHHGFVFTQAFPSIGSGLASALGAALASPGRLPVAACGGGGFLTGIAELDTIRRLGLGMLIVVWNDEASGTGPAGHGLSTVVVPETDLAAIARGHGCAAVTVRRPEDLDPVREWLAGPRELPMVVDAKVTAAHPSWWEAEPFGGH